MALQLVTNIKNFIGEHADFATLPTTDIPIDSTFYETDTYNTYIFNGTNWVIRK